MLKDFNSELVQRINRKWPQLGATTSAEFFSMTVKEFGLRIAKQPFIKMAMRSWLAICETMPTIYLERSEY